MSECQHEWTPHRIMGGWEQCANCGEQRDAEAPRDDPPAADRLAQTVTDAYRGMPCEVKDSDRTWRKARFIALDLIGFEPLVQYDGCMPIFATWGTVRGLDKDAIVAAYKSLRARESAPAQENARLDRDLGKLIDERDHRDEVIDEILDLVLGSDRHEWSSHYDFADAIEEVKEVIRARESTPAQEPVCLRIARQGVGSIVGRGLSIALNLANRKTTKLSDRIERLDAEMREQFDDAWAELAQRCALAETERDMLRAKLAACEKLLGHADDAMRCIGGSVGDYLALASRAAAEK